MVSHDDDQDASVRGAHDDHDDDAEIRIGPGKESEMRRSLAALAVVSWCRQARPHSALSSNTSFSSHLSLGAGQIISRA